jgi:5-methylcytosine-specific restriction endonuclease McrA
LTGDGVQDGPLPEPGGAELAELPLSSQARAIYRVLYENRDVGLTMREIRAILAPELGEQEQLDRRRRELNRFFVVERSGSGRDTAYVLTGVRAASESDMLGISERTRAQVLQFGRCAMCGRTAAEHRVVLQVDHKMPRAWGGSDELDNLQPLCEECNRGKKSHFQTLDEFGPAIRAASVHLEPHRRIGELLKAFYPEEVRSDVLEMVAHQHQYQEDWQKRLRELRVLGWVIKVRRERDADWRMRVYYRLAQRAPPWPGGNIHTEITRREQS